MNNKVKNIIEQINKMNSEQLIELNNVYYAKNSYNNYEIHKNDENFFSDIFGCFDIMSIIKTIESGRYHTSDGFVIYDKGYLHSFPYMSLMQLCDSVEMIAVYVSENEDDFSHLFEFNNQ